MGEEECAVIRIHLGGVCCAPRTTVVASLLLAATISSAATTLSRRITAIACPVTRPLAVQADVVAVGLALAVIFAALVLGPLLLSATGTTSRLLAAGRSRVLDALLPLLLPRVPLLLREHQLAIDDEGLPRDLLQIVHRLQSTRHLLDGEIMKVEEGLDGDAELRVLGRCNAQERARSSLMSVSPWRASCYFRAIRRKVKSSACSPGRKDSNSHSRRRRCRAVRRARSPPMRAVARESHASFAVAFSDSGICIS